ncbi:sulfotransferase [uncultured Tateyamaria sp.]|uniref:sulfotransferase n=1 Tax=uncultured Tateyamaria sp. TaxID=455651 RepID=UPI0026219BE2|nr:sulfotransferase [uncultured Tateyamaria sp.]
MLHRLALGSNVMGEMQFDLECGIEKPKPFAGGQHVFVTGLARAGTTVLMRSIYGSEAFGTLTYRDMPFVMAPNLWARLHRRSSRDIEISERAHGDGILVNADSPEAFEEVFWRIFLGHRYLNDKTRGLVPHEVPSEVSENFRKYVQLILKRSGTTRYLSKNNNNILRIAALLDIFPDARILVPFRRPVPHAQSLLAQHQRFCEDGDRFTRAYMTWLAHHEFGPGHRPFVFSDQPHSEAPPTELLYWLEMWGAVYGYLVKMYQSHPRVHFVCYEQMCHAPQAWASLSDWLDLPAGSRSHFAVKETLPPAAAPEAFEAIYRNMTSLTHLG